MALVKGDWAVAANGAITEVAGTSTHRVIELHRFLMGLLDDTAATGDDLVDVSNGIIPSARSTDQIITLNQPYNIDQTVSERFFEGSITYNGGDDIYSGLRIVGKVEAGTQPEIISNNALVTNFWGTDLNADATQNIIIEILLKTRTAGVDIDNKKIRCQARELGDTYAEFEVTLGESFGTAALFTNPDDFNTTIEATIATWGTITNTEGYRQIDVDGDTTNENYYSEWTKGSQTEGQLFERAKWIGRRGTSTSLYGLNGSLFRGITHEINLNTPTGTVWVQSEVVSWGTGATAGTGALLAVDNLTAASATKMWIQLLTGAAPTNGLTIAGATATNDVNVTVTSRTVNTNCFLGNYTGSLTGAFGVGVVAADLENITDRMRALDNVIYNPPNNVALVATGIAIGDTLFAAKTKTDTDTVSGAHSAGDTAILMTTAIPTDYDQIGRVFLNGTEYVYISFTGSTFTLAAPGLGEALSGGEPSSLTQFYNDEFTTTADAGSDNGVNDSQVQFTVGPGSAWPAAGWVWLWDGVDRYHEYAYSSFAAAILTLDSHVGLTADASTTTTVIIDAAATFETWNVKPGMRVYNTTRSLSSTILSVDSETQITLATAIAGQVSTDGYEVNTLVQSYGAVKGFIAFVSEVVTVTSVSKTITYSADVPGRWRLYNSAANITPFEVGFTITSGGSSTPLTRISDA